MQKAVNIPFIPCPMVEFVLKQAIQNLSMGVSLHTLCTIQEFLMVVATISLHDDFSQADHEALAKQVAKVTTFEPKQWKTTSLQSKGQKTTGPGSRVEVWEQVENVLETAPVGLQEGAGGQSFTVLYFPKDMHSCPRVRDNYTAASQ